VVVVGSGGGSGSSSSSSRLIHLQNYTTMVPQSLQSKYVLNHDGIQNCWGFRSFPLTSILETRKHDILESGSVSILR
jgi:hypothetical protein